MQLSSRKSSGFTMIEVMIGMVLTGILSIGMIGLWAMVGDQFFRNTLRQKAVFVLRGYTDKLSAAYRFNTLAGTTTTSLNSLNLGLVLGPILTDNVTKGVKKGGTLDRNNGPTSGAFNEGDILYMNSTIHPVTTPDTTNFVWLDYDNDVTARLTWSFTTIGGQNPICYDVSNTCNMLEVTLEYPYRFQSGSNPANASVMWGSNGTESIAIRIIVGQRL
jgi:prepilin-type N-terminal cleavage/methylation domain-containing protein